LKQTIFLKSYNKNFISAWRFPPVWPFTSDYTELVSNTTFTTKIPSTVAKSALKSHLANYLDKNDIILEIGCSDSPFIVDMTSPISKYLQITSENLKIISTSLPYESAFYDHIVISSGIEYVSEPRDLFREVWRVLRPGGRCFVSFLDKPVSVGIQEISPISALKMWTTMTEEQKIWIAGRLNNL
jgi:SAM-dependent methyltransferase